MKNKQIVHEWCRLVRPGVQSACARGSQEPGLVLLNRARTSVSNWKAGKRNWREEAPFAAKAERKYGPGAAYDAGLSVGKPRAPLSIITRTKEAIAAGLPAEIEARCFEWLRLIGEMPSVEPTA